jgi:hypothetical protein
VFWIGLLFCGGVLTGVASIVSGTGYLVSPRTGPPGFRFGEFGDPWVIPAAFVGGVVVGLVLLLLSASGASRMARGRPAEGAVALSGLLVMGYAAAAALGIWISFRADPPLPPSWDWIRIPQAMGLIGAVVWIVGALFARPVTPSRHRAGTVPRSAAGGVDGST